MDEIKGIKTIHRNTVDPADPIRPINSGFFQQSVGDRLMLTFVPDDVGPATAGVFVLPPNGVSAKEMALCSNWVELAQSEECKERFNVFFLEAENGTWKTDEPLAAPGGETAYLQAAFDLGNERTIYGVHEAKFYLVGYGDGGVIAQKAAAENPSIYAGVAAVGSPPLDEAYLSETAESDAVDLGLFEDTDGQLKIPRGSIPVPVFIIGEDPEDQLAQRPEAQYWRKTIGAGNTPRRRDRHTLSYIRTKSTPYPYDQDKAAYRMWVGSYSKPLDDYGNRLNRTIWKDFLYPVRRWMSEPGGSLRTTEDPIRDLDAEYHYELVDGWMREWYVYVPSKVREAPQKAAPLVFACHGYSCSGEIYMGNSGWNRVADQYGCIVIFPCAVYGVRRGGSSKTVDQPVDNVPLPAWNVNMDPDRPDEVKYFKYMLSDAVQHHCVDTKRIFVTGHSMGSLMTQYLATFVPDMFAAVAPCSGVLFRNMDQVLGSAPQAAARAAVELPIWMFGGEKEAWLLPHLPKKDNITGKSIHYWWKLNQMPGVPPECFNEGWTVFRDRWHDLVYKKDGVPMIRYTWIDQFPHATNIEMSFRIWEGFFSKFQRGADGTLIYLP